ncbi:TatD family hydrolase [Desertivirga arenae]|uniref:TatD family hydrolase n=1 Tax=Desertivirga arenae TaxID=2810309 RepID=UPI001A962C75|nr:TatD family hydrolase [Pedobacter sp. SYSU D00823]
MILTDTHTHQYYEKDAEKLKELMQRCLDNKVERLFLPNVDSESISLIKNLVKEYPVNCFAMLGLHPCDVKENYREELDTIFAAIPSTKIYAIGEIGIDLYWDKTTLELQQKAFHEQIGWAKNMDLPIVIHCREAFDEVYEVLLAERDEKLRGIFHCFSGTVEQARKIIDLGFYLGIGGVVTYKKSGLDKVVEEIPLDNIVLETDSPYLTPVPYRGKPNESSYLVYVAQKVADIKQISLEEVAAITTENSKIIFNT